MPGSAWDELRIVVESKELCEIGQMSVIMMVSGIRGL
jgi:hypothetical protein